MKRWWMSFWFKGEDYRPLNYPPSEGILGWWCSGYGSDGNALCLLVEAETEEQAKTLLLKDWPESADTKWRFCNEQPADWLPNDRFPFSEWMKKRIGAQ